MSTHAPLSVLIMAADLHIEVFHQKHNIMSGYAIQCNMQHAVEMFFLLLIGTVNRGITASLA